MSDDIVIRLRRFDEGEVLCGLVRDFDGGKLFYGLCLEASNEIERLRQLSGDSGKLREERDEARREICLLRDEIESLRQTISRSQEVSLEWIRETQNRARMMDGKLE